MSDEPNGSPPHPPKNVPETSPPVPDARDETIEQLERLLAAEKQDSATMRNALEELRFKVQVLEKSYSKQLADARQRADNAELKLADQQAQIATLDSAKEDALRLLAEVRAERDRAVVEPDRPCAPPASSNASRQDRSASHRYVQPKTHSAQAPIPTIDELIADSSWLPQSRSMSHQQGFTHAQVGTDDDAAPGDMLAPELIFAAKKNDEDAA